MKYSISSSKNNKDEKKYEIELSIATSKNISGKDKEKIYRVIRIIHSLGQDSIDETSDKEYRFQTDQDYVSIDDIVKEVLGSKNLLSVNSKANEKDTKKSNNMFEKLGLKK